MFINLQLMKNGHYKKEENKLYQGIIHYILFQMHILMQTKVKNHTFSYALWCVSYSSQLYGALLHLRLLDPRAPSTCTFTSPSAK